MVQRHFEGRIQITKGLKIRGGNHMAKKRKANKTKIKRKRTTKKDKSKKQPNTYVPTIPT